MNEPQAPKPTRTQDPSYHVFRQAGPAGSAEAPLPHERWEQLTKEPVKAASRKQAVEKVLEMLGQLDEKGPFLVVPAKECWRKSKRTETTKVEVWS